VDDNAKQEQHSNGDRNHQKRRNRRPVGDEPEGVHRDDEECPVREVDDVHDAEDHRQPERDETVDAAEQDAEDDELCDYCRTGEQAATALEGDLAGGEDVHGGSESVCQ